MQKHGVGYHIDRGDSSSPDVLQVIQPILENLRCWATQQLPHVAPSGDLGVNRRPITAVRLFPVDEWNHQGLALATSKPNAGDLPMSCLNVHRQGFEGPLDPIVDFLECRADGNKALWADNLRKLRLALGLHQVRYNNHPVGPVAQHSDRMIGWQDLDPRAERALADRPAQVAYGGRAKQRPASGIAKCNYEVRFDRFDLGLEPRQLRHELRPKVLALLQVGELVVRWEFLFAAAQQVQVVAGRAEVQGVGYKTCAAVKPGVAEHPGKLLAACPDKRQTDELLLLSPGLSDQNDPRGTGARTGVKRFGFGGWLKHCYIQCESFRSRVIQ